MKEYLVNLIKMNGPISIAQFMHEALFNQSHGYYMKHDPFGKKGDFTTAPEISQVFGELILAYLISIWQNYYPDQEIRLVEMGAGRGTLMNDILLCASKISPDFYRKIKASIIEISPKLREIQKQKLANFSIEWFTDFETFTKQTNSKNPLFFVANELFDCCAIRQFVKTNQGWVEKLLGYDQENNLVFKLATYEKLVDDMVSSMIDSKNNQKLDAVFEYSSEAIFLIDKISKAIKNSGGIGLIIDYGYTEKQFTPTLQAVKNQNYSTILNNLGNVDISALVDFGTLKKIADQNGLSSSITSQKDFLEGLGIKLRQEKLIKDKNSQEQQDIQSSIERLTDPKQMGELFKFLIIWNLY